MPFERQHVQYYISFQALLRMTLSSFFTLLLDVSPNWNHVIKELQRKLKSMFLQKRDRQIKRFGVSMLPSHRRFASRMPQKILY